MTDKERVELDKLSERVKSLEEALEMLLDVLVGSVMAQFK